jgi:hypothetical protein
MKTFSQYLSEYSTSQLSGNLNHILKNPESFNEVKTAFMKLLKGSPFYHVMPRSEKNRIDKEVAAAGDKSSFMRVVKKYDLESRLVT